MRKDFKETQAASVGQVKQSKAPVELFFLLESKRIVYPGSKRLANCHHICAEKQRTVLKGKCPPKPKKINWREAS